MILCADVGGTKTTLALFRPDRPTEPVRLATRPSAAVAHLGDVLAAFLAADAPALRAACFGVAGPVVGARVETTNLPWVIDGDALARTLGVPVFLLNDLEALAHAIPVLRDASVVDLSPGAGAPTGTIAVIAAGTGLGEAGLLPHDGGWLAIASEGGHADFAPRSPREIALLQYLLGRWEHVSVERVVSGPGIVHVLEFLRDGEGAAVPPSLAAAIAAGDPAAAITTAALAGDAAIAVEALAMFVALYGAEAGNLALTLKATGGAWVGGGIAPKILPKLRDGTFREAFLAKGRFRELLERIPVRVIVDEHAPLYGAARYTTEHLRR
jgi:glucokinase